MSKGLIVLVFLLVFQSFIPLKNVHAIDNYEIKEVRLKPLNDKKGCTKSIVSYCSSPSIAIKYLRTWILNLPVRKNNI